jgi:hypothetical protein
MSKKILSGMVMAVALLAASVTAQAIPITYTLQNVTFADGATASGSFVFDANTHQSSSYSISTTPGILTAFTWNKSDSGLYFGGGAGPNNFTLITTNGGRVFNFSFVNPFTDAGGIFAINTASTYECYNCSPFRRVTGGTVTSVAPNVVPEPGTVALMLPAIGALGFAGRRRRKQAAL